MLTGDAFGLSEIVFSLGLCAFALWKTGWVRVLLSLCVIIWGAFAMPYDIKIAASLVSVGVIVFIIGILNLIKHFRGGD